MKNGRLLILVSTGLLATLLWDYSLLRPVRYLAVLVHEMWHGLSALLVGARLEEILLRTGESGETVVQGFSSLSGFLFSISAGYPGTALTGALMLNRGIKGQGERITLALFSLLLAYMSQLFTSSMGLAYLTGMGWAAVFLLLTLTGKKISRYALITLGTVLVWYSIYDIFDFTRDIAQTDAGILARYLSGSQESSAFPAVAYSVSFLWTLLILLILYLLLKPVFVLQNRGEKESLPSQEPSPGPDRNEDPSRMLQERALLIEALLAAQAGEPSPLEGGKSGVPPAGGETRRGS